MSKREIVVGDVHGCYDELRNLLSAAKWTPDDDLYFIGDIVDRGQQNVEVIEFCRDFATGICKGNHERKHILSYEGKIRSSRSVEGSRQEIIKKRGEEFYKEVLQWFDKFHHFIDLESALLVHGFMDAEFHPAEQDERVVCGVISGEKLLKKKYGRLWYEVYAEMTNKPVIVGHFNYTNSSTPFIYKNLIYGIDTSCCAGGSLTAIVLPEFRFVSVPRLKSSGVKA